MKMEHIKGQYNWLFSSNAVLAVDEGWTWLVSGLVHALDAYENEWLLNDPVKIIGISQRMGSLSIVFLGGDYSTDAMIRCVEMASNQVCQSCASTEDVGGTFGPSIYTLCRQCWLSDEKYHFHLLSPNILSEMAAAKIEAGLLAMEEGWFKKRLQKLIARS